MIDIHTLLEKNPITKKMLQPKFGYKYLGLYNRLNTQLLYDKQNGDIFKYYDKPKNILDKIASTVAIHIVSYTFAYIYIAFIRN